MLFCYTRTAWHRASAPSSDSERQLAGLAPRMSGMQSRAAVSFPLLFLPPTAGRTGYFPSRESREARVPPLQGKPRGRWALPAREPRWGWGVRLLCAGSARVEDLLCAPCFVCSHSVSQAWEILPYRSENPGSEGPSPGTPNTPAEDGGHAAARRPLRSAAGLSGCRQRAGVGGLSPGSGAGSSAPGPRPLRAGRALSCPRV